MKRQRAQNLVEFGIVFPVFLLLVIGLLDLGRAAWYYNTASFVARDAARQREFVSLANLDTTRCTQMFMLSACQTSTTTPPAAPAANSVTITDSCSTNQKVEVDYGFRPATFMFFGGQTVTLTATSYVPTITGSGFCPS
jgi:hypothetical protein